MSWQDDWRLRAWEWARRLDAIATGWLMLERDGNIASSAVQEKRKLVLKVRSWIYEIIERFLGGVDKLPNTLGALPHLVVGGAAVVTVATIGAWIANEEERLVDAKTRFVRAVGEEVAKTTDPEVKRKLAGVAAKVAPDKDDEGGGFPWGWLLLGLAVTGGAGVVRKLRSGD